MKQIAVVIGRGKVGTDPSPVSFPPLSDRAALTLAQNRTRGEICAYSFDRDHAVLRYALAAGAGAAYRLAGYQALVANVAFDLALIGRGACEEWGDYLPAALAEASNGGLVFDVLDFEVLEEGRLRVTRDLGRGAQEVLQVEGRAVLVISDRVSRMRYISQYRLQSIDDAAIEHAHERDESEGPSRWERTRPRAKTTDLNKFQGSAADRLQAHIGMTSQPTRDNDLIQTDAENCAWHLLRYLRHHGFTNKGKDILSPLARETVSSGSTQQRAFGQRRQRSSRGPRGVSPRPRQTKSEEAAEEVNSESIFD